MTNGINFLHTEYRRKQAALPFGEIFWTFKIGLIQSMFGKLAALVKMTVPWFSI